MYTYTNVQILFKNNNCETKAYFRISEFNLTKCVTLNADLCFLKKKKH